MTKTSSDNLFANVLNQDGTKEVATETEVISIDVEADETETEDAPPAVTELDMLKNRARLMGVVFSNNIGLEALKAKINAKLEGEAKAEIEPEDDDNEEEEVVETKTKGEPKDEPVAPKVKKTPYQVMFEEQMKLVRLRITNLNPAKKDLPGEIFTVANKILGSVKKFVPYGEATENGYHVPVFIYNQLKEREFQNIKTRKDSRGRVIVETGMAREFALEVLPPLTELELAKLAAAQAAAKGMD
jgi:hypothetical protein